MWYWRIFFWIELFGLQFRDEYFDIANPGKTQPAKGR